MPVAPQGPAARLSAAVGISSEVLLRDAVRGARRWQTHAVRVLFTGILLSGVLTALHLAVTASQTGAVDVADLSWLGRGLFVAFTVLQLTLAMILAPLSVASGVIDETDEGTLDLLVLTPLRPGRVFGGLVLARLLTLATVVAGALPVLTLLVSLGGMSAIEVVAVTVHTLTALVMLGLVGAVFGLFTRSPMLATAGSVLFVVPGFWLLPAAYATTIGSPTAAARFSPFLGPVAQDLSALLPPLSFLPSLLLVFAIGRRLFALRVSGASITRAFDSDVWGVGRWMIAVLALLCVGAVLLPVSAVITWRANVVAVPLTSAGSWLVVAAEVAAWGWFVAAGWCCTWVFLRLGTDLVFTLDNLLTRRAPGGSARPARVWSNPVAWREARPRVWGSVAMPILVTWGLVTLTLLQSFSWVIPGGILFMAAWTAAAALLLTVWVATHSVESERRWVTLPVLLTTTTPTSRIVLGKLAGVAVPALPLLLLTLPLLVIGYLHAWPWMTDPTVPGLVLTGLCVWLWLMMIWIGTCCVAMLVALRVQRPGAAFGTTLGGAALLFGLPVLAARLLPDVLPIALPARILAPPLAGGAGPVEHLLAVALAAAAAAGLLHSLVGRLRRWGGVLAALLCLASATARAADPVESDALVMQVDAVGDGWVRARQTATLQVTVRNLGRATRGTVSLAERHGDGIDSVTWERAVELPEGAHRQLQLRFQPSEHARPRKITLTTRDRRSVTVEVPIEPVPDETVLIGVLGDDLLGLAGIRETGPGRVPGRVPRAMTNEVRGVRAGLIPLAAAPDHAAGYRAFDWVVWPRPDPSRLSPGQLDALLHTVADGGHLLLTVTDGWRLLDGPLAEALPVELRGLTVVEQDLGGLLGLGEGEPARAPVASGRVPDRSDRAAWSLAAHEGGPLWVAGTYGLGTIHVLLADPSDPALRRHGGDLWRRLLFLPDGHEEDDPSLAALPPGLSTALRRVPVHEMIAFPRWDFGVCAFTGSEQGDAEVRAWLSDIPGVAPVPLVWLIALSSVYLLLIGPVDFLVLRALGRPSLTWITFPLAIAVFSGIALAGTTWTKGSQAVVSRVEVVDWLPGTDLWRGHSRVGVFATRKTDLVLGNGFPDGTVSPLHTRGFMNDATVRSGEGPTELSYRAETWTLAYSHSAWITPLGPGPALTQTPEGITLDARLPFDLDEAWLMQSDGVAHPRWWSLGALRAGDLLRLPPDRAPQVEAPFDEDILGLHHVEQAESGHLHLGEHAWAIVGLAAPVEPLRLSGLDPVERPLTLVRIPLTPSGSTR